MERRTRPRWPADLSVRVTDLLRRELSGTVPVIDVSERGLGVCLPFALEPGTYVSIEVEDSLFFAFVVYSNAREQGGFRTGLDIVRVLTGKSNIASTIRGIAAGSAWRATQ